jgi:signal transduction histidine kinase
MRTLKQFSTLRVRLVLWSMLVNAFLLIAFGGGIWLALRQVQYRQVNDMLQLSAAQLSAATDLSNGQLIVPADDVAVLTNRGVFAWVINGTGHVDLTIGQTGKLTVPTMMGDSQSVQDTEGNTLLLYRYVLKENSGTLIVGISLEPTERTLHTVLLILAATIPLALLVSSVGAIFLAGRVLNPIAEITAQAKRISRENLTERLAFDSTDEVGQLGQTFDSMLDRIQAAFEHERQFIGNVSHELRTPLGMLKAQISLALSRPREVAALVQMMHAMDSDVDRMTRLVESMLTLIHTEATPIHSQPVNLGELLAILVSQLQPLAAQKQITLTLETPSALWVWGDSDQLVQLFLNLIDNALKYCGTQGKVGINVQRRDNEWQIAVSDTGIGIGPEHLPHVFDRFYRVDPSRTRQTGGIGLGLAISQAIAHQHGGQITVQSQLQHGSIFTVVLPIPTTAFIKES